MDLRIKICYPMIAFGGAALVPIYNVMLLGEINQHVTCLVETVVRLMNNLGAMLL